MLPCRSINKGGALLQGAVICVYYLKTGACKYGATCKFDHPPPGEVVALTASQAQSESTGGKT